MGNFPLVSETERGYLCPFYGPVASPSCSSYFFNTDIVKIKFGGVYHKKQNQHRYIELLALRSGKTHLGPINSTIPSHPPLGPLLLLGFPFHI